MKQVNTYLFLFFVISLFACGGAGKSSPQAKVKGSDAVDSTVKVSDFWQDFDFADSLKWKDQAIGEQAIVDFLA